MTATNRTPWTPEPWAVCQPQGKEPFTIFCQTRNWENWVCQGPNVGAIVCSSAKEMEANAQLIALAPEMVDLLPWALAAFNYLSITAKTADDRAEFTRRFEVVQGITNRLPKGK